MLMMSAQVHENPKTTELYAFNGLTVWSVNSISGKLFKKKDRAQ